jgi:predicted alpha/beta superfamily hydrolase
MVLPMMYAGDVPPTIIVGIGYQVDSPFEIAVRRARDLLPTPEADFAERMSRAGLPVLEGVTPGGADAFLAFIDDEVKPLVADHYPVDVEDQTLVGYSYGGTFAFHVLLSSPESFDRYVIGSPVLARDEGELIAREAAFARSRPALDATVFLSAGEYEVENGIREPTEAMMKTLRSRHYAGLRLLTHVFPEETHESAIASTISRGLRAVFGTWPRGGDAGED